MKKRTNRVYWRERGGVARAYGDFRDFADVNGGRERLIAPGERLATTDPDVAAKLAADRVAHLDGLRRGRALHGIGRQTTLHALALEHLRAKSTTGGVTVGWVEVCQTYLERMLGHLGSERDPASVTVADIRHLIAWLERVPTNRRRPTAASPAARGTLTAESIRHHLAALSNLFARAASEGYVPPGFNPVAALMEKPRGEQAPARWLEVSDAALLLEAARTLPLLGGSHLDPDQVVALRAAAADGRSRRALAHQYGVSDVVVGRILRGQEAREAVDDAALAYPLMAAFLLTGGREKEVYGLEIKDLDFERRTVTFRPNEWRRLKTQKSRRTVPLWPQLATILREYLNGPRRPKGRLLFPVWRVNGAEAMLTDCRKLLDRIAIRAGWAKGEIRTKIFRHTYASARLQTVDHGAPVSIFTVSRELGHSSTSMLERVYAHLGSVRHRAPRVEYRIDQHQERLGNRARRLVTRNGTTDLPHPSEGVTERRLQLVRG